MTHIEAFQKKQVSESSDGMLSMPTGIGTGIRTMSNKRRALYCLGLLLGIGPSPVLCQTSGQPRAESTSGEQAKYVREKDPKGYVQQLKPLRNELRDIDAEMRRIREFRKNGKGMSSALAVYERNRAVSPDAQLELLSKRRAEVLQRIDELEDLARRNDIAPGLLREDAATTAILKTPGQAVASAEEVKDEAYWRKRFAEARRNLRAAEYEADILQREHNVALVQYDPNPTTTMLEELTRMRVSELKRKIDEKRAEVVQLRQALSELEDELRRAGGPPGWGRE